MPCACSKEDGKGIPGVFLKQTVRSVAAQAFKRNLVSLGRVALPLWMQVDSATSQTDTCMARTSSCVFSCALQLRLDLLPEQHSS